MFFKSMLSSKIRPISIVSLLLLAIVISLVQPLSVMASENWQEPPTMDGESDEQIQASDSDLSDQDDTDITSDADTEGSAIVLRLNAGSNHPVLGDESNFAIITDMTTGDQFQDQDTVDLQIGHEYLVQMYCINSTVIDKDADWRTRDAAAIPNASITLRVNLPEKISVGSDKEVNFFMNSPYTTPSVLSNSIKLSASQDCHIDTVSGSMSTDDYNYDLWYIADTLEEDLLGVLGYKLVYSTRPGSTHIVSFIFQVNDVNVTAETPVGAGSNSNGRSSKTESGTGTNATQSSQNESGRIVIIPEITVKEKTLYTAIGVIIGFVIALCITLAWKLYVKPYIRRHHAKTEAQKTSKA